MLVKVNPTEFHKQRWKADLVLPGRLEDSLLKRQYQYIEPTGAYSNNQITFWKGNKYLTTIESDDVIFISSLKRSA